MTRTTVSVLGLGAMGSALARAFLAAGHPTTVWNRNEAKAQPLVAEGARQAASAAEAVAASELVVLCVTHYAAAYALLPQELSGTVLVNLCNGTPKQARQMSDWARARGASYVDGGIMAVPPMIGTSASTILFSGDERAFRNHRDVLSALGTPTYLGADPGVAALHDLALLSAMYGMFGGFLHAVSLVRAEQIAATELMTMLRPFLEEMLPSLDKTAAQIDSRDYGSEVDSPLAMQAAAFDNFLDSARDSGVRQDLLAGIGTVLAEAVAAGHGQHDLASLVEVMRG